MNEIERKKRYRQHRLRIQKATSLVDSQAPKHIQGQMKNRELTFIEMMGALYSQGNQRTFTQSPVRSAKSAIYTSDTRKTRESASLNEWPLRKCRTSEESLYQKRRYNADSGDSSHLFKKLPYDIPLHVWQRYNHLSFVKSPQILFKLLRPRIFLDLQVENGRPLGRLVVQLFTEACPEIVLQFVRVCMYHQHERFSFSRLFVPLWLEGELHLNDKNALTIANMEHDPSAINHGSGAGILSFPSRYLRGSKFRFISFSVSFKPIDVLNGKRIAFGKIRHGQNILDYLQNIEVSCCGKPMKDILVTSCGVL